MGKRKKHVIDVLRTRPNNIIVFPLSALYLLGVLGVYTYMYNGNPFLFYRSFPTWFTITTSVLNVIISVMLGIAIVLFVAKIKELRVKSASLGVLGVVFGGLAAGCPGCFFGLFPVVLGLFGITGTLAILPWNGIEFQLVTVALLSLSLYFLSEETNMTCALPKSK